MTPSLNDKPRPAGRTIRACIGFGILLLLACAGNRITQTQRELPIRSMAALGLQHDGSSYRCPWTDESPPGFWDFLKWQLKSNPYKEQKKAFQPNWVKSDMAYLRKEHQPLVYYLGHAGFLVRLGGAWLLIDPVLHDPPHTDRLTPAPCRPADLPPIDYVLISHNHYDHLDLPTLKDLGDKPTYLVPSGTGELLRDEGLTHVIEMNWYDTLRVPGLRVTFLPAQHSSRRGLWDEDAALWGSWMIESPDGTIYHAGDSGYFRGYKEFGVDYQVDLAILPIGAFEPRWFMKRNHMDPAEALQAATDLKTRVLVPMHYGVFDLSDEPGDLPPKLLQEAYAKHGDAELRLRMMRPGETVHLVEFHLPPPQMQWETPVIKGTITPKR